MGDYQRHYFRIPPPGPCQSCHLQHYCKVMEMACSAFTRYVNAQSWKGTPKLPTKATYRAIFEEDCINE